MEGRKAKNWERETLVFIFLYDLCLNVLSPQVLK